MNLLLSLWSTCFTPIRKKKKYFTLLWTHSHGTLCRTPSWPLVPRGTFSQKFPFSWVADWLIIEASYWLNLKIVFILFFSSSSQDCVLINSIWSQEWRNFLSKPYKSPEIVQDRLLCLLNVLYNTFLPINLWFTFRAFVALD